MKLYLDGATESETISKQIFFVIILWLRGVKTRLLPMRKMGVTAPVVPSFERTVGKRDTKKTTQSNILLVDDD